MSRARTITLDWRHWTGGRHRAFTLFLVFTLAFNFVTLKWAAAVKHPWLQAIVLADQREEAQRMQERVQGHLNAMAMRLGELQAQVLRLDGSRRAPRQDRRPETTGTAVGLPGCGPGARRRARRRLPARDLTRARVLRRCSQVASPSRSTCARTSSAVLEALLMQDSVEPQVPAVAPPISDGWYSSNFGYRIDPFTGQQRVSRRRRLSRRRRYADRSPPPAARSSSRACTLEYGKMVEIDHGNGMVTRYAHASKLRQGGRSGPTRATSCEVGTTGRSTGPHLHFEVRLNGVPQNPARFLQAAG